MMAQMQNIIDFPPAPKLLPTGRLDPSKATQQELAGEQVFHGQGAVRRVPRPPDSRSSTTTCTICISSDFTNRPDREWPGDAAGRADQDVHAARHQDSPPYMHDGRLLTLADTVEFFNLVLSLKLTQQEKECLVAYMLAL